MKKLIFLLVPALLMLASCHSSKKMTTDNNKTNVTTTEVSKKKDKKDKKDADVQSSTIQAGTNFTAKIKATVVQDGQELTTNGALRMRYDDVIQITLVDPILGVTEVGRLELSPDNILLIDRLNKRYVSTTYEEFMALKSHNIDFATIQDFFWQEAQNSDKLSYTIPAKKNIKLDLKLSNKGSASDWNPHTTVSGKYTKTDINRLFGSMLGN